jgi:RNA polymerase sigma factor (sigma-70 family)
MGTTTVGAYRVSPEALREGCPHAFAAVYHAHVHDLMRLLVRGFSAPRTGGTPCYIRAMSRCDAEELCHETFLRFFEQCRAGRFDAGRPVRPYLRRIAANLALTRARRGTRETLAADPVIAAAADAARPEDAELARLFGAFRAGLAARDQEVLTACVAEAGSQEGIGERLDLSRDQVYRSLVRIRRAARAYFRGTGWFTAACGP